MKEWYTHPRFVKYEVNHFGVVRNRRTHKELKSSFRENYSNPQINVLDYLGKLRQKSYGSFVLEAINQVKEVEDFIYIDNDKTNHNYFNLKQVGKIKKGKRIAQISSTGVIIKIWSNISEARDEGDFCDKSIISCCKGRAKTHREFYWCYEENIPNHKVTMLVATKQGEQNHFANMDQAYFFFKKAKVTNSTITSFRSNVSHAKSKGILFLDYKWTTIEKHIES